MIATRQDRQAAEAVQADADRALRAARRDELLALGVSLAPKLLWLACLVHELRRSGESRTHKAAWAGFMVFLPSLGCTTYVASSLERGYERRCARREASMIESA